MSKKISPSREQQDKEKLIYFNAPRGERFKNLIKKMLVLGKIKDHYISQLLSNEALSIYSKAFTSNSITSYLDPMSLKIEEDKESSNNYEMLEKLGDGVFDNFIGWYAFRRFGNINTVNQVKVVHIIRSKYGSKNEFSPIAEKLGFWPFISAARVAPVAASSLPAWEDDVSAAEESFVSSPVVVPKSNVSSDKAQDILAMIRSRQKS